MKILTNLKTWNRENMSGWRWLALGALIVAGLALLAGVEDHQYIMVLALLFDLKHDMDHLTTTDAEPARP